MKILFASVLTILFGGGLWWEWSKPLVITLPANIASPTGENPGPLVVELFTSEGCSSCPPADALLAQLASQPKLEIIPLSEHVDYWNYIGWTDPFSAPQFSERQRAYARAFGANGLRDDVYTPQMVIDGRYGFVGSRIDQAQEAIQKAVALPKAKVQLTQLPNANSPAPASVIFEINIASLPTLPMKDQIEVLLAVTEDHLASNVSRGENRGRRLPHTAVTRDLRKVGEFASTANAYKIQTPLKLNGTWNRSALRVVTIVQARQQRHILGAASSRLTE